MLNMEKIFSLRFTTKRVGNKWNSFGFISVADIIGIKLLEINKYIIHKKIITKKTKRFVTLFERFVESLGIIKREYWEYFAKPLHWKELIWRNWGNISLDNWEYAVNSGKS